jgi:L-fuculose-phosphate aldolase
MSQYTAQKQRLIDACLQLADRGFLAGTGGNLALRLSDTLLAVTPSAADYYRLKADDICVVRSDTLAQVEGDLKPSVETAMHARLLRAKPQTGASIHTHQPLASAVALLNLDLPLADPAARLALGDHVAIVPYAPSGTGFLVRALGRRLRPNIAGYLLCNHGVICGGATLDDAITHIGQIEAAAAAFLRSQISTSSHADSPIARMALSSLTSH